jgi:hypothetical protein
MADDVLQKSYRSGRQIVDDRQDKHIFVDELAESGTLAF